MKIIKIRDIIADITQPHSLNVIRPKTVTTNKIPKNKDINPIIGNISNKG